MKRPKRKTKRQRKSEQFMQMQKSKEQTEQLKKPRKKYVGGFALEAADTKWIVDNLRTAKSDKFFCRVLDYGYGGSKYQRDANGNYSITALNAVDHAIVDVSNHPEKFLNRPNRLAITSAINEFRCGTIHCTVVKPTDATAQQAIQRIDASKFVLKDELSDIIKAEVARLRSPKESAVCVLNSQEVEKKIEAVNAIMTKWVQFKREINGTDGHDYPREYGKLYEKVAQVRDIVIPRDEISKAGEKIIHWLANNGHIDATLAIARRSFSVEAA